MYPISNDGAALLALFAGAFPLQFTAGTLESGPKALGEGDSYSEQCSVAVAISLPSRLVAPPTCLETRTKDSNMYNVCRPLV